MPIPVQLHNSLVPVRVRYVPVQLCRTTTTTRVLYTSTTTVPVPIILGKLYSVQPYNRTRTLNLKRSQKVTKTTVFVCWNIFFKKSIWNRFAAGTRLERHTCTQPAADRSIWLWRAPGLHVRVNQSSLYSRLILAAGCVQCLAAGADF